MLVLVPSRDDADSLRVSLPKIRAASRPGRDRVVVVADRCTDDTEAVARSSGVDAIARADESSGPGKGGALRFGLGQFGGPPEEAIAVFDADSVPSPEFFARAEARFAGGDRALQAYVEPVPGKPIVSRIAAYSEIVSQRISGRLRERLGWGVPLRGTGMVIERRLLEDALARCETYVEDLEITLLLAAVGVPVRTLDASVRDPKPDSARGVAAQRARWLAGNARAFFARRREIGSLLRSFSGMTLVGMLFARPRSLLFSARLLLFLALLSPAGGSGAIRGIEIVLGIFLFRDLALLVGGLFAVDRPSFYLPAVLAAPLYPVLWAFGAARSFSGRRRWLSARRRA
jgi:cellulose synthase/poly-beta-1,6-N-acetylglucosamine synthase-like glycosyltransferase